MDPGISMLKTSRSKLGRESTFWKVLNLFSIVSPWRSSTPLSAKHYFNTPLLFGTTYLLSVNINSKESNLKLSALSLCQLNLLLFKISTLKTSSLLKNVKRNRLTFFYKISNKISPPYVTLLVQNDVGNTIEYNFRNVGNIWNFPGKTSLFSSTFLPQT